MRKTAVLALLAALVSTAGRAQVSPNSRHFSRPERDGSVVTAPWTRAELRYQYWDRGYAFLLGPSVALPLFRRNVEIGGRGYFVYFDPERATDRGKPSDIDLWGKILVLDDPLLLTVGGLVTLPTGSKKIDLPISSGKANVEAFSALRLYVSRYLALTAHTGIRYNDNIGKGEERSRGKFSFGYGGGAIIQATPEINILAELNVETERFRDDDNSISLTGGFEYLLGGGLGFNGGLSVGLDRGAPDFELIAGLNYLF